MIKRLYLFLLISLLAAGAAFAQATGTWNLMPVYGGAAERLVDTPDKVYYLSSGHLFSYDKEADETRHYSSVNSLNDVDVTLIAYNPRGRYLAVVYSSHNIDLLYDNGRVVNLPDIRDANISSDKTVSSIDFTPDGRMYVATGFGFVAFDDSKHRVADSGIYNEAFVYAGEIGGHVVLVKGNEIYASPVDTRHNSFDSFTRIANLPGTGAVMHRLGTERLVARNTLATSSNKYYIVTPDFAGASAAVTTIDNGIMRMDFCDAPDGSIYFASGTVMRNIQPDGTVKVVSTMPSGLYNKTLFTRVGTASIWASDFTGVGEYSVSDAGTLTMLRDHAKPESLTCSWPAFMTLSPDGSRIYISNVGYDPILGYLTSGDQAFSLQQTTNIIENGMVSDVTCYNIDNTGKVMTGGTHEPVEDPSDPSVYYIANFQKGIYRIKDGEQVGHIARAQMPFSESWAQWVHDVRIDRHGNLWMGIWTANGRNPIYILPADKLQDMDHIQPADWLIPAVSSYSHGSGIVSLMHSRTNNVLYSSHHNMRGLLVYDHKGTETNLADDTHSVFTTFVDQDGAQNTISNVIRMVEDPQGQIWVCHERGIFVIPDIATAIRSNVLYARKPKVARNDGTNYADYLLDGEPVMDISVDPAGRKWIATKNSGAYLVSADGTQILENYTTENSSLPSNKVLSVVADPQSSYIYFGTEKGVVCYSSSASPAAEDYSDVYAYPNPVRPDYTGWITITGLMDNSLVKITDAAGNLVHQGTSEGGMYLWNGCSMANQRVRSGVYFVFASQNAAGSASGKPVTKIMVIN
ncbi:MAG: hypothetical protein K2L76_02045 [Muribaculaceae bacterium]|nr:hypothetical protein [Muribaculaceae bacterium]